jgi:hypothetical protein
MEGPTPVSSLLHSATLVTAGVVLLLLLSELIGDPFDMPGLYGACAIHAMGLRVFGHQEGHRLHHCSSGIPAADAFSDIPMKHPVLSVCACCL